MEGENQLTMQENGNDEMSGRQTRNSRSNVCQRRKCSERKIFFSVGRGTNRTGWGRGGFLQSECTKRPRIRVTRQFGKTGPEGRQSLPGAGERGAKGLYRVVWVQRSGRVISGTSKRGP